MTMNAGGAMATTMSSDETAHDGHVLRSIVHVPRFNTVLDDAARRHYTPITDIISGTVAKRMSVIGV